MSAANQSDHGVPISSCKHILPPNIIIRPAAASDSKALADCFYTSFYPSHAFWTLEWPPSVLYDWFVECFRMGTEDDATMRTFVAVDTDMREVTKPDLVDGIEISSGKNVDDGRVVAFTRWRIPVQPDKLDEMWPELPVERLDMNVMGPFFEGMANNRRDLMKGSAHWFLQLLGTETKYQGQGIGLAFVQWGCGLADEQNLEVYIDASEDGAPFYQKHFGAVSRKSIDVPDKPEGFGKFNYFSHVRPRKSERRNGFA